MVVTIVYLLTNLAYLVVLDKYTLSTVEATAVSFGIQAWGPIATTVIPMGVAFSTFGALFAGFFSNSRLAFDAGRNGHLPSLFTFATTRSSVPITSILVSGTLASVYTLSGSVGFLIQALALIFNFYSFLTMVSLFVLRFTKKDVSNAYRAPTLLMVLRLANVLFLLIVPLVRASEPLLSLVVLVNLAVGGLLYAVVLCTEFACPGLIAVSTFTQKLLMSVPCSKEGETIGGNNM